MNEQYTIEELGLARSKEEHIEAVVDCIIAEDIVLYGASAISSDEILDNLSQEFKRRLVHLALDSQNPVSSKVRDAIYGDIKLVATRLVNNIQQVF